ncbi:MAG: hypothetical protein K8R54_11935 [Bacteroidales bacterium]|nr:hypothetical protein [Bacteroidales bacterium]
MKSLLFLYFLIISLIVSGQENQENINLIITINDELVISGIQRSKVFINTINNEKDTISCQYNPGKFIVFDNNKLKSDTTQRITLSMWYQKMQKENSSFYYYEIELEKSWFEQSFIILRIYNLDKRKFRKKYYPLKGKKYTYEIDLPSNSITRIRKR